MGTGPHAAGVLLTHGDRALFLKRSDKSRDHAGEWCCPGGSLEDGETPEQAAARELNEETSLTAGNLTQIDEGAGFVTFRQSLEDEQTPTLNEEHTDAVWAPMSDPPQPLHPGVAATLKKLLPTFDSAQDKREWDTNGWFEVQDNPLSTVGVYPYSEASVIQGGDRNKMVGVYRSPEELSDPETVKSFRLMPWTDDHPSALLGDSSQSLVPAEQQGVHGVIGEQTYFKDGVLYGNIKVFSEALARKIAAGKRELSCGYRCDFVPCEGTYNGTPYQYAQKNLRGNHVASVRAGRMGSGVRVLDAAEPAFIRFSLDMREAAMTEKRKDEMDCTLDADTQAFIADSFNSLVGQLETKGYSKEYATKVAGKVAAEKGMTGHDSIITPSGATTVAKDASAEVKDPEGKDDPKKEVKVSEDGMGEESEGGMDAKADEMEAAKDAAEEEKEKEDESAEARDRRRARDRRAGARDARKMARDKMAKDAKGKGMDAAEVQAIVDRSVKAALSAAPKAAALDSADIVKQVVAQTVPAIRKEEAAKASLYGRVSPLIGAFDHAEMTHADMATYSLDKLGVTTKAADPVMALDFFLAGRTQAAAPQHTALDAAVSGDNFMSRYLNA